MLLCCWCSNDKVSAQMYKKHEAFLKKKCEQIGAEFTVVRAGTLKGGGCGEKGENPEVSRRETRQI